MLFYSGRWYCQTSCCVWISPWTHYTGACRAPRRYSSDPARGEVLWGHNGVLDDNIPQPWRARSTLVLTLSLVAAGLGNLQRFPYLMGEHGGGAFFVSYLIALCVLSVPVLTAEVAIGSLGRGSPRLALHWAASVGNLDSRWRHLGVA